MSLWVVKGGRLRKLVNAHSGLHERVGECLCKGRLQELMDALVGQFEGVGRCPCRAFGGI